MRLRAFLYVLSGLMWAALPMVVYAAGLVPCDGALDCNICTFGKLIQNVMNFAIGLSIPIAALLFAYAGWLYFSNRENFTQIEKAKSIFFTVLIGFAIAIAGWLVVQTILKTLAPGYQSWNNFTCSAKRVTDATIGQVLEQAGIRNPSSVPAYQVTGGGDLVGANGGSAFGTFCSDGSAPSVTEVGNICVSSSGEVTPAYYSAGGNSGQGTQQWLSQLQEACASSGLSDCALAQAIMANESSGRAGVVSAAGAVGLMQVMPKTACGLDSSISGCSSGNYSQVAQSIADPATNMRLGTQYIAQLSNQYKGDPALIAAAYNGGPPANSYSTNCGGGTAWQCQLNPRYAETRNYVPKVLNTYSKLK